MDHRVRKDILGKMIDSAADLPHGAGEDAAAQTRKSSADELKQLRAVCRNAFQLCGQTLSDPVVHARAVIISELPQPSHQWYALQAHVLRAVEDGAVWFRSQICGDFWGHLRETFRQLRSPAILEKLGIHLHDNELPPAPAGYEGVPSMPDEDLIAMTAGQFCQCLVYRRTCRNGWMMYGYPAAFQRLLYPENAPCCSSIIEEASRGFRRCINTRHDLVEEGSGPQHLPAHVGPVRRGTLAGERLGGQCSTSRAFGRTRPEPLPVAFRGGCFPA